MFFFSFFSARYAADRNNNNNNMYNGNAEKTVGNYTVFLQRRSTGKYRGLRYGV